MRKIIVCNLMTLDGYYEGKNKELGVLFKHFHKDYANDENLDIYMAERLRSADCRGRNANIHRASAGLAETSHGPYMARLWNRSGNLGVVKKLLVLFQKRKASLAFVF